MQNKVEVWTPRIHYKPGPHQLISIMYCVQSMQGRGLGQHHQYGAQCPRVNTASLHHSRGQSRLQEERSSA